MTRNQYLLRKLKSGVNHQDAPVVTDVVLPIVSSEGDNNFKLGSDRYTPSFKAQVQANILTLYFTEVAGVYTATTAAAVIGAGLSEQLPVFLFANGDFAAGYAALRSNFPLVQWTYNTPLVMNKQYMFSDFSPFDATVLAQLRPGDVVQVFTATTGGTDYVALRIIRFSNVAYAHLLEATNSNAFKINLIRYTVANTPAGLAQFANPIFILNETMFGKFSKDSLDPESYQNPEQNQPQIVDVQLKVEVMKEKGLATLVNPDVVAFRWNLFIQSAFKI